MLSKESMTSASLAVRLPIKVLQNLETSDKVSAFDSLTDRVKCTYNGTLSTELPSMAYLVTTCMMMGAELNVVELEMG